MPALDFKALMQAERARRQREAAMANAAPAPVASIPPAAAHQEDDEDDDGSGISLAQKRRNDAVLAFALSSLLGPEAAAAAIGGGGDTEEGGGDEDGVANQDIMAMAAAKAVEEARHTRQLLAATLEEELLGRMADLTLDQKEGEAQEGGGLAKYALPGPPSGVFYVPEFVPPALEAAILGIARSVPEGHPRWVRVRGRRLQCYGGEPTDDFKPQPLPAWVQQLSEGLITAGVFPKDVAPDHVLLNEYKPGEGIMAHTDGPFYEDHVAILSLGGPAIFHFRRRRPPGEVDGTKQERTVGSVVLQPRSLIVFTGEAYHEHLHEIRPVAAEVVGGWEDEDEDGDESDWSDDDEEEDGEEGRDVREVKPGAPVLNLAAAGVRVGDVVHRRLRVSLTFRRVKQTQKRPAAAAAQS